MQELDIKRGHSSKVDIDAVFKEHFGTYTKKDGTDGTWYEATGPALKRFAVCMKGKTTLLVEIEEDRTAATDAMMKAIRIKNTLLESLTGFTAKQRAKRAQEAAKKT